MSTISLEQRIQRCGTGKEEQKALKKQVDRDVTAIKAELLDGRELHAGDKLEYPAGEFTAVISVQDRSTTNSEKLLARLKELGFENAIKVVEVPDEEVVEQLVYDGAITPQQLADCIQQKEIQVLKITRVKE